MPLCCFGVVAEQGAFAAVAAATGVANAVVVESSTVECSLVVVESVASGNMRIIIASHRDS